jgi:hypothetical protein
MFLDAPAALLAEVEAILGDVRMTAWVKVFDEWKNCVKRCIDAQGECLSSGQFDLHAFFKTDDSIGCQDLTRSLDIRVRTKFSSKE